MLREDLLSCSMRDRSGSIAETIGETVSGRSLGAFRIWVTVGYRRWRLAEPCVYVYRVGWRTWTLSSALLVVGLTVGGAAIGLAVHGRVGALTGVIPGALAAVVAGYVPVFRDNAPKHGGPGLPPPGRHGRRSASRNGRRPSESCCAAETGPGHCEFHWTRRRTGRTARMGFIRIRHGQWRFWQARAGSEKPGWRWNSGRVG